MMTAFAQGDSVGELAHGGEHTGFPMAPADARPPAITRGPAPSPSQPPDAGELAAAMHSV